MALAARDAEVDVRPVVASRPTASGSTDETSYAARCADYAAWKLGRALNAKIALYYSRRCLGATIAHQAYGMRPFDDWLHYAIDAEGFAILVGEHQAAADHTNTTHDASDFARFQEAAHADAPPRPQHHFRLRLIKRCDACQDVRRCLAAARPAPIGSLHRHEDFDVGTTLRQVETGMVDSPLIPSVRREGECSPGRADAAEFCYAYFNACIDFRPFLPRSISAYDYRLTGLSRQPVRRRRTNACAYRQRLSMPTLSIIALGDCRRLRRRSRSPFAGPRPLALSPSAFTALFLGRVAAILISFRSSGRWRRLAELRRACRLRSVFRLFRDFSGFVAGHKAPLRLASPMMSLTALVSLVSLLPRGRRSGLPPRRRQRRLPIAILDVSPSAIAAGGDDSLSFCRIDYCRPGRADAAGCRSRPMPQMAATRLAAVSSLFPDATAPARCRFAQVSQSSGRRKYCRDFGQRSAPFCRH